MQPTFDLLKDLALARGVSGFEKELGISHTVKDKLPENTEVDRYGNVICTIGRDSPTILVESHIDEVGFMITKIEDNGILRCTSIGYIDPKRIFGQPVDIHTDKKTVKGVITASHDIEQFSDLFIDIGANNRDDVDSLGVRQGNIVSFEKRFFRLGESDTVCGIGLDNRVGCCAMVNAVHELDKNTNADTKATILGAATVQHEQGGGRGAALVVQRFQPDYALILDSAYAQPLNGKKNHWGIPQLGKGPAIQPVGARFIVNSQVVNLIVKAAQTLDTFQFEVPDSTSGGTNAGSIFATGIPSLCGVINTPVRYQHTAATCAHLKDIERTAALVCSVVEELAKL